MLPCRNDRTTSAGALLRAMTKCFSMGLVVLAGVVLSACGQGTVPTGGAAGPVVTSWVVSDWADWKQQDTGPEAKVRVVPELPEVRAGAVAEPLSENAKKAGVLVLERGEPFTVVRYEGKAPLPLDEYEISWEAARLEGNDFFAALTFPVGSREKCATLVTGGWGGWTSS